jgi:molecular chaperone IbpA
MQRFDFTPFFRSTVGFDRLFDMLDTDADAQTFPPYNIERLGDNSYRITMAVAGFTPADIKVEVEQSLLKVTGEKTESQDKREYLHRGIAGRSFERRFQLADFVEVTGADIKDGLLHIELKREVPERMKPRTIAIGSAKTDKVIEHKQAA